MVNILLVCSAGMSTSALVKKMQDSAAERGIDAKIWAVGGVHAENAQRDADVVMLGPQVSYLLDQMKGMVDEGKPVAVIDMLSYGRINGAKVLDDALALADRKV
ncbi:MAG: PTS sugar transporter subunit IIB [Bifidobacteriaceae bacterium]|nr:PTS sugar transporter subunit IIB [Bifidobacteriaceae bacterium]